MSEDKDDAIITPSRLMAERRAHMQERILALKLKIKNTLLSNFTGMNSVTIDVSGEDAMVITEAVKCFSGGEDGDRWKIDHRVNSVTFSVAPQQQR